MKYLVLIGDGMADFPLPDFGNRTPLELAATPGMDQAAAAGICALFCPIPAGFAPGSEIGNLSLFGYDPSVHFTGRAPMEAASQGIALRANEVAFRCNLVTITDGAMASFNAGHITSREGAELIQALNATMTDYPVRFYAGVSYRNLAVVTATDGAVADLAAISTTPPHNIPDQPSAPHLPQGTGAELVREIMERSRDVLSAHPVNRARGSAGKPAATSVWLWGQGVAPELPTFSERFGLTGAVVSAVDLVKGIGRLAGLDVIDVPGATGYIDTNYPGKAEAALTALATKDFVYVHVEAPDETAHEGRPNLKVRAIEDFDRFVVQPCLDYVESHTDVRLLIAPDHITSVASRVHEAGPVPFALVGAGVEPNAVSAYTERDAARAGAPITDGHILLPRFIEAETITVAQLQAAAVTQLH